MTTFLVNEHSDYFEQAKEVRTDFYKGPALEITYVVPTAINTELRVDKDLKNKPLVVT